MAMPVWKDQKVPELDESTGMYYIEDKDYRRQGFIVNGK